MIPNIKWAQTKNSISFDIDLQNIDTFSVDCIDDKFICSYIKENETDENEFELELFDEVETFVYNYGLNINVVLEKKENVWWSRLTKKDIYKNKIKIDWDKWKDEDESEDESEDINDMGGMPGMPPGMNMEQIMEMMKNMQGGNDDDGDEDDQEIPKDQSGLPGVCPKCP